MVLGMTTEQIEATTTRGLYFEGVGAGYGRDIPAGTAVTVRDISPSEQIARHIDGVRVYEALVNHDDYEA